MTPCRPVKAAEQLAASARYELLLRLAAGGMGSVFLGVDRRDPTALRAIKRAHPHLLEDAYFRKMFAQEARLALRIDHPNAIGVLDVDDSDGELLMVMRYVEGASLADLLRASRQADSELPRPALLRVIADAARGLDAAHQLRDEAGRPAGIVHRDVSPHNILVGIGGVASIVDFGVAKARGRLEVTNTTSDMLKGKIGYMSPEYLRSRPATPRSDVFSLGIVAWEALTSKRLFRCDSDAETMQSILSADEALALDEVLDLEPSIARVVARALAKDPDARFATAGEFADALEAVAEDASSLSDERELAATVMHAFGDELEARREMLGTVLRSREEAMSSFEARKTARFLFTSTMRAPTLAESSDSRPREGKTTQRMSIPLSSFPASYDSPTPNALSAPTPVAPPRVASRRRLLTFAALCGIVGTTLAVSLLSLRHDGGDRDAAATEAAAPAPARPLEQKESQPSVGGEPPAVVEPTSAPIAPASPPAPSAQAPEEPPHIAPPVASPAPQRSARPSAPAARATTPPTSPSSTRKRPSWETNPYAPPAPRSKGGDAPAGI